MTGQILHRKYFLKHTIAEKIAEGIKVTVGQGRRHKQLLDDRKETRGYCKLKDEALGGSLAVEKVMDLS